jgi:hypothetical protein
LAEGEVARAAIGGGAAWRTASWRAKMKGGVNAVCHKIPSATANERSARKPMGDTWRGKITAL